MKKNIFRNKTILVTGGTGTIGSGIVRELLKYHPKIIRIYSIDENAQHLMGQKFPQGKNTKIRYLIGDVRDFDRLKRAVEGVEIIFHAAALKHIDICEYDPTEAIKTNITGTQNVIMAALEEKSVERVVFISTDKAVNPTSVMGATKLLCEKMIAWAMFYRGKSKPIFSSVRFGNVINSRGSIIPLFKKQIQKKGFVTITHPEMKRFFMSLSGAVNLIFKASEIAKGGEVFVLKMPCVKISDLIEVVINKLASIYHYNPLDIKIKTIGVRGGEKIDEDLLTTEELTRTIETEKMFIILPKKRITNNKNLQKMISRNQFPKREYSTKYENPLKKEEIEELFQEELSAMKNTEE
ncbi:MAG: polysaccharide biosynthesis protein [Nanoarchaeota archaeon]|nr:polysaccharide biosynthesis protein [Nanoarchaeota archaeon]